MNTTKKTYDRDMKKLDAMIAEWSIDNAIGNSGLPIKKQKEMKAKWLKRQTEVKA